PSSSATSAGCSITSWSIRRVTSGRSCCAGTSGVHARAPGRARDLRRPPGRRPPSELNPMAIAPETGRILTVSALTRRIKEALGERFPAVWVKGELTGFKRSDRGHLYFSLKDATALIECMMWKDEAA